MGIKTTLWDSVEHLKTEEDIHLYLEACLEEAGDDPTLIIHALGVIARAKAISRLKITHSQVP
jgi:probable addiction module antidote protein